MIHNYNDTRLATSNRHLLRYDCFPTPPKNLTGGFRCPAFPIVPNYKMILVAGEVGSQGDTLINHFQHKIDDNITTNHFYILLSLGSIF